MKEEDLALKFMEYFADAEIFKEVKIPGGIVDFVARYGLTRTAVEVKNTCSMAVIEQAFRNLMYFHYSYIAVPTLPNSFQRFICFHFGIGVLRCDAMKYDEGKYRIVELEKPALNRKPIKVELCEFQKLSVAGSVCTRETHFTNSVKEIKKVLGRKEMTLKELFTKTHHYHWASLYSARNSFADLVTRGIIKGIEINDGIVKLTEN